MGCRHSTPSTSKHFVSSIRTISMHAEEMLANELIHDSMELKKREKFPYGDVPPGFYDKESKFGYATFHIENRYKRDYFDSQTYLPLATTRN
jgi:hypothetical protein